MFAILCCGCSFRFSSKSFYVLSMPVSKWTVVTCKDSLLYMSHSPYYDGCLLMLVSRFSVLHLEDTQPLTNLSVCNMSSPPDPQVCTCVSACVCERAADGEHSVLLVPSSSARITGLLHESHTQSFILPYIIPILLSGCTPETRKEKKKRPGKSVAQHIDFSFNCQVLISTL